MGMQNLALKNNFLSSVLRSSFMLYVVLNIGLVKATTDLGTKKYISNSPSKGSFALSATGATTTIQVSPNDFPGVIRAVDDLKLDIKRVTGNEPNVIVNNKVTEGKLVLIGTIKKSLIINKLVKENKINISGIEGKWETFIIQTVKNPLPGVDEALVIAGSDKRGTIYGIYDLSTQIGVSPWYWWADVPTPHQDELYVLPGVHSLGTPKVKYRGIFINDEAPAMSGWTWEKNGGFNSKLYTKVFELILRLKGNYLWPAMWGNAFNYDDSLNSILADEYGIVMSTSHHEPMLRAQQEWKRFGKGKWNYQTNEQVLKEFWTKGIQNMGTHESVVTIGMRGDGDEPMSEESNIALLERIVKDQRDIIEKVTKKPAAKTPQVWALYKEVQEYYDKGMRVPDDVTLLLCDDNWGNIRKLPDVGITQHSGGYGIYYHFDYVGGPRNYKWVNTVQVEKTWEQMHLAWEHGVNRIWLVNVGDIKPVEFPIEFFLDYAWDPDKWTADNIDTYTALWAEKHFGAKFSNEIASIIKSYTKFNNRRKPEMLSPKTYSLLNYREADMIVEEYNKLVAQVIRINDQLPAEYKDAFFQLVMHPVTACANLNDLYVTVGKNRMYAKQERASTNELAAKAEELFKKDAEISDYYNTKMAGGKWNHMMDQTHIGYTYWQQPDKNVMPEVETLNLKNNAEMGVAVEGMEEAWPQSKEQLILPKFNVYDKAQYYIDVFNMGKLPLTFTISGSQPWIKLSSTNGSIEKETRVFASIDWTALPKGIGKGIITITDDKGKSTTIIIEANNPEKPVPDDFKGFVETDGYISIEAEHYSNAVEIVPVTWKRIPNLGRTLSAMTAMPYNLSSYNPGGSSPRLEYSVYLSDTGVVKVKLLLSPTLNYNDVGLKYGISFDDELPQVINMHKDRSLQAWEKAVGNGVWEITSTHKINQAGAHTVKFWLADPGVVLQKIIIDKGGAKPCYLGPPESFKK